MITLLENTSRRFNLHTLLFTVVEWPEVYQKVMYLARLMKLSPLVGKNMYAGASFEAGNAWLRRSDINSNDLIYAGSAFIGIDSTIGPVYFGFGHAEGGMNAVYLSLGAMQF